MACSLPSTSGRALFGELVGRAASEQHVSLVRGFASLVGSGIPSPRPDVALQLSTPHGGHINRMILSSESLVELDCILYKHRKKLRPANIGAASVKLEQLYRYERSSPYTHKVQEMATELQKYVETFTDRLALRQTANVVRAMASVSHPLPPDLLVRLAAGVVAEGGRPLSLAPDVDVRDLAYGFGGLGFNNPVFWSRFCSAVLPRLPTFNPNTLPALIRALSSTQQLPSIPLPTPSTTTDPSTTTSSPAVALATEALRILTDSLPRLQPARLADTAQLLAELAPQPLPEPQLVQLEAAAAAAMPSLAPSHLANLLLALSTLRRAAGAPPPHLPPNIVSAGIAHLTAAAQHLQLLHIKRAVQALGPAAAAAASSTSSASSGVDTGALLQLLDLLARRAAMLLPPHPSGRGGHAGAAVAPLSRGELARLPRGGKDAGLAVAAVALGGVSTGGRLVGGEEQLLGLLEGLTRSYAAALAGGDAGEGAGVGVGLDGLVGQCPNVVELFGRVAVLAVAGWQRGRLSGEAAASLGRCLPLVAGEGGRAAAGVLMQQPGGVGLEGEARVGEIEGAPLPGAV